MSMTETELQSLDMTTILLETYEIADMIKNSAEVADYLYWKQIVEQDEEVQHRVRQFQKKKELFEECQRFGHYHPDYHAAQAEIEKAQAYLEELEMVRKFKSAEEALDEMLHSVSTTIARSVSENIKVPSNNPLPTDGGCGSGGSCSGKCS
jgi:cell fate (sporulation/competence/biofilm development) regulator YlbF (YheA/YmcA/DUF963 family)